MSKEVLHRDLVIQLMFRGIGGLKENATWCQCLDGCICVNGVAPKLWQHIKYNLKDGDKVVWYYVIDYAIGVLYAFE